MCFMCCYGNTLIGQTWREKVANVRTELEKEKASALVATALDEVACESAPPPTSLTCTCIQCTPSYYRAF